MLTNLYKNNAKDKIKSENFHLGDINQYGQRVNIHLDLIGINNEVNKISLIITGWIIEPNGNLKLATPFTG